MGSRSDIPPSIKVLLYKATKFLFYTVATLASLSIAGVDLASLTVFTGALGLGIGFGLQKVISNLISGVIILLDKSIKPGDVIEVDGTYGWINSLHTRYVSVRTRDRKEHLIPNEDLVTNKVINWSFSDNNVRIKADVGVSYDTDIPQALEILTSCVEGIDRVLKNPKPVALLISFGDSSINLQLRFWINDPAAGVTNCRSQVMLNIWQKFKEAGIQIPYPQRDLHIVSSKISTESSQLDGTENDTAPSS